MFSFGLFLLSNAKKGVAYKMIDILYQKYATHYENNIIIMHVVDHCADYFVITVHFVAACRYKAIK